jgi:FAD/FMN-containing dehydrogenase
METGLVTDGVLAQDQKQADNLWRLREGAAEALTRHGYTYKYDVSVPTHQMYSLVELMRDRLDAHTAFAPDEEGGGEGAHVMGYGHLGDGNLHLNVVTREFEPEVLAQIEPFVFERVAEMRGSVSAEHGIGRSKVQFLGLSKSEGTIGLMKGLKRSLDPNGILNPYKVLSDDDGVEPAF